MRNPDARYIRVPVPGKKRFEFIEIDPARLTDDVVQQLWMYDIAERVGTNQHFKPVARPQKTAATLDVSELLELADDLILQCHDSIAGYGTAGEDIRERFLDDLPIEDLLRRLGAGDVLGAQEPLRAYLYGLLSAVSVSAQELEQLRTEHANLVNAAEGLGNTLASKEDIQLGLYYRWGEAAMSLCDAVDALARIEREVRVSTEAADAGAVAARRLLDPSRGIIATARSFLILDTKSNFAVEADRYLRMETPDATETERITALRETALQHIANCRREQTRALDLWKQRTDALQREVVARREEWESLIARIDAEKRQIRTFREMHKEGMALPPDFSVIERHHFDRSTKLFDDPAWRAPVVRQRLQELLQKAVDSISHTPGLDPEVESELEMAEAFAARIHSKITEKVATVSRSTMRVVPPPMGDLPPERFETLIELMTVVAYVLTCKANNLASTTVPSMLDILVILGKATEEERRLHAGALRSALEDPRICERLTVYTQAAWNASRKTWLVYQPGRPKSPDKKAQYMGYNLKLTASAEKLGRALLEKHQLTAELVRAAHEKRKLAKAENAVARA